MHLCLILLLCCGSQALGVVRYVDSAATGANNGTSWANAWTHPTLITSVTGGDIVYISGGSTSKTYNFRSFWDVPNGNSSSQLTIAIGQDAGHDGMVIFNYTGGSGSTILTGLQYVTFDFWHNNTQHLTLEGPGGGVHVYDDANSHGFKLLGAIFARGRLSMYASRKIEIGWCKFNTTGTKLTGGPGWLIGAGSNDRTGFGNNSIHDCEFNLFYRHGVDASGDNGDDAIQNVGAMDIYNCRFISKFTSDSFAGANHQDFIQTDGWYTRIWNNYLENPANYGIFLEFWGPGYANIHIWNNIINYTDPVLTSQPSCAIAIGYKFGPNRVTNCKIFNNLIIGGHRQIDVVTAGWPTSTATDVYIVNNLWLGGGHIVFNGTGAVVSNNVEANSSYFVNVAGKDFHLTSSAKKAINAGTTKGGLTSISMTDRDGKSRGARWDVGPYEFAPVAGPGTLTFSVDRSLRK